MQPLFQGKLDNFCAIYAVLNALTISCQIPPFKARDILNTTLMEEAKDLKSWFCILNHYTDYMDLVGHMLERWEKNLGFESFSPFRKDFWRPEGKNGCMPEISLEQVWNIFDQYACASDHSCVLVRFCRFLPGSNKPLVDHWSVVSEVRRDSLILYDCSLEPSGWYILPRNSLFSAPFGFLPPISMVPPSFPVPIPERKEEYAMISPESLFVVRKKAHNFWQAQS